MTMTPAVRRVAAAVIGALVALAARPIEALGGIDGHPGEDAPTGDRPWSRTATVA